MLGLCTLTDGQRPRLPRRTESRDATPVQSALMASAVLLTVSITAPGSWANLTSSLKFATLGENLSMEIINQKGELTKINFETKI